MTARETIKIHAHARNNYVCMHNFMYTNIPFVTCIVYQMQAFAVLQLNLHHVKEDGNGCATNGCVVKGRGKYKGCLTHDDMYMIHFFYMYMYMYVLPKRILWGGGDFQKAKSAQLVTSHTCTDASTVHTSIHTDQRYHISEKWASYIHVVTGKPLYDLSFP